MKHFLVLLLVVIPLQTFAGRVIKNPEIEYSPSWMTITEIELTREATIVRAVLAGGGSVLSNTVLKDRGSDKEYKLIRVEGINPHKRAAGDTKCTIYFEPLAPGVREFNYVEVGKDPFGNFYGIKLHSKPKSSNRRKAFTPESLGYDHYMSQPFTPDSAWHFSNEPYKDIITPGKAQIKIHLARLPKELAGKAPSVTLMKENQILRKEETTLATLDDNSCYTLDIDLLYPQHFYMAPFGNIFIIPGDTLEVFSTLEPSHGNRSPRYKTFRSKGESAVINTLLPKFVEKYGMSEYDHSAAQALVKKGKDATQRTLERLAGQVNEIFGNEEFRQDLINTPLSTFGKDVVMMSVLAGKCIEIEDFASMYSRNATTQTQREDGSWNVVRNPGFVPLDKKTIYETLLKHKELLYDNPIALCESNQWVFVNRTLYGPLFYDYETTTDDKGGLIYQNRRDYGMAGTFINDLNLSQQLHWYMEHVRKDVNLGVAGDNKETMLDRISDETGKALAGIRNVKVAQEVVSMYRDFVKATETGAAVTDDGWTAEQKALWDKIVSPYKGNVLFLDLWGMGCGPCRAGMMSQKPMVEEMKGEACRFIYITTTDDKASGEKWMKDNNINGEHVYVTREEWKLLKALIGFSAIPRGVLVGKDGKLIESDFYIGNYSTDDLKSFVGRF